MKIKMEPITIEELKKFNKERYISEAEIKIETAMIYILNKWDNTKWYQIFKKRKIINDLKKLKTTITIKNSVSGNI